MVISKVMLNIFLCFLLNIFLCYFPMLFYGHLQVFKKTLCKRIDICIYITESLCCIPETITTLLINYDTI